jgi:prepilin-type N-terminal cleavage/methylation domain-containing protein
MLNLCCRRLKMNYCSKKILLSTFAKTADSADVQRTKKLNAGRYPPAAKDAFSLIEVVAALVILAFVSSSVLVVINRYMASAADSVLRMQAFEVARTNMEGLLTSDFATESIEYGNSEKYPDIEWETVVETFYEPLTSRMWVQAICSAEYTDSEEELQTVELTHWLTDVTKGQLLKILAQQQDEIEQLADQVIETLEEAAEYAGVDAQTMQQWMDNGMLTTQDGYYIKGQLDLYMNSNGPPTAEDRAQQAKIDAEIIKQAKEQASQEKRAQESKQTGKPAEEPTYEGYTMKELEQMSLEELFRIFLVNR